MKNAVNLSWLFIILLTVLSATALPVSTSSQDLSNHSLEPRSVLTKAAGQVQKVEQKPSIFRNCLDACMGIFKAGSKKPAPKPSEGHRVSLAPQLAPLPWQDKYRGGPAIPSSSQIEPEVSPPPKVHRLAPAAPRLGKSGEPEPGNVRPWKSQPDLRVAASGGIGYAVSKYSKPDLLPAGVDRPLPPLPKGHGVEPTLAEAAATPSVSIDKRLPPLPQRNVNRPGHTPGTTGENSPSPLNKADENGSPLIRTSMEIVGGLPGRETLDHSTSSSGPPPQGNRFGSMPQINGAQRFGKPTLPLLDIPDIHRKPLPRTADIAMLAGGASPRPPLVRRPVLQRPTHLRLDPNAKEFRPSSQWSLSPDIVPTPQHPPSQHPSAQQSASSSGILSNDATQPHTGTLNNMAPGRGHIQDSYFPPVDSDNQVAPPFFTPVTWNHNASPDQSSQRTHMLQDMQDSSTNSSLPTPAISLTNPPPEHRNSQENGSPLHPLTPHTPQDGMLTVPGLQGVPKVPVPTNDERRHPNDPKRTFPGGWF